LRRLSGSWSGTTGRSFTTESPLTWIRGPHHHPGAIEGQLRRVEEVHLAQLRLERVDAERGECRAAFGFRDGELQLDAVGALSSESSRLRSSSESAVHAFPVLAMMLSSRPPVP
jgi:hypothetical protein